MEPVNELAHLTAQRDALAEQLRAAAEENARLRAALRAILEDPDAKLLDSDRDIGWAAIAQAEQRLSRP